MLYSFQIQLLLDLRAWILHEHQLTYSGSATLSDIARGNASLARAYDALAEAYRDLTAMVGLPPNPDLLRLLGPVGELIHVVTCQTKDCWAAFRRGVARRYPDLVFEPRRECRRLFGLSPKRQSA